MAAAHIPLEIFGRIINEIRDDSAALHRCGLVCRDWLPFVRQNVFHAVVLTSQRKAERFWETVAADPLIAEYVRLLRFNTYAYYMSRGGDSSLQDWVPGAATLLAPMLPQLTSLEFEYISWNMLAGCDEQWWNDISSFGLVQDVSLFACTFATFSDFERLLQSFPRLKHVSLRNLTWEKVRAAKPYNLPLNILKIQSSCPWEIIYRWLVKIHAADTLRGLEVIGLRTAEDLDCVSQILVYLGPALESLTIGIRFTCDGFQYLQGE